MKYITDETARSGFMEDVALDFENQGRELAESGKEYKSLRDFNPFDTYAERHVKECANHLHFQAYAKRRQRIERKKSA